MYCFELGTNQNVEGFGDVIAFQKRTTKWLGCRHGRLWVLEAKFCLVLPDTPQLLRPSILIREGPL